jgi:putative nucleotidyltransferase with HDIG domain
MLSGEALAGACALAVAVSLSTAAQWDKLGLFALLLALAVASDSFPIFASRPIDISGSFLAIVLAMALIGPTGAVAIALVSTLIDGVRDRKPFASQVNNIATYAIFPLVGVLVLDRLSDALGASIGSFGYAVALIAAFAVSLGVNFGLVAAHQRVFRGLSFRDQVRTLLIPFLPSELLTALLGATVVSLYPDLGLAVVVLIALILTGFQYVLRELQRSNERAERLREIQVDVLFSMVKTLSLRDRMTARHSAAVARYAQAIARAAGATSGQQRLVHTAGLLHDIGKSIFPDHVLFADGGLSDEQWDIVRQHPAHGASMIAQIEEFAEVAELVRAHHERIDGKGYPQGLVGEDVPWLSRMLSIADTYDVMTSRDSYRDPVSPEVAIAELRRVSGTQLDAELVEVFVRVLSSEDLNFAHSDDADLERELEQERRRLRESGAHVLPPLADLTPQSA